MLPELPLLPSLGCCVLPLAAAEAALPIEDIDGLRRDVRFVWTWETLVGVCGRARSAAAAAADDRALFGFGLLEAIKAAAAAVEALGFAVSLVSCGYGCCRLLRLFFVFAPPNMLVVSFPKICHGRTGSALFCYCSASMCRLGAYGSSCKRLIRDKIFDRQRN